jgi:excisionase family DNA binding protein
MDETMIDKFLTIDEVADRLQISRWTVQDHRRRGLLKASRLGRRVRVSEDEFNAYVERLRAVGSGEDADDQGDRGGGTRADELRAVIESGELDEAIAAACRRSRGGA